MEISNVGVVSPGDMGSAIAKRIKESGKNVHTALDGRSERKPSTRSDANAQYISPEQLRRKSLDIRADVERIDRLWASMRERHGAAGAFLFGKRSIADAFYLPVATRFRTYGMRLSTAAQGYADELLHDADFQAWQRAALAEDPKPFSRAPIDSLYTTAEPRRASRAA